jgi:ComEC/Rec2-related protein
VSYLIRGALELRSGETNVKKIGSQEHEYSLSTKNDLFRIVVLVVLCVALRGGLYIYNEKVSLVKIEGFTSIYSCWEVVVYDEPDIRQKTTQYYVKILSDELRGTELDGLDVLLRLSNFPRIGIGDHLQICGTVNEPENFDDFDYKKFLMNKKVYGIVDVKSFEILNRRSISLRSILYDFKQKLVKRLEKAMVEPEISLLVGILFGEERYFNEEFEGLLRNSGTTHIVAASGYNVTILILAVERVFRFLKGKTRTILSLVVIWLFCLLSGISASIVRATIMGSLVLFGRLLGRYQSIHRSFIIGIWLFVFFSPTIMFDVGFQLSILATAGLVYLSPSIENWFERKGKKIGESFREYTLTTMSCTLSTLPVSVITFGTFSSIGILANTLILPVLESTMLWGSLGLLSSYFSNMLSKIFLLISFIQLKYFEIVVSKLGRLDFLVLTVEGNVKNVVGVGIFMFLLIFIIKEFPVDNEEFNYYFRLARGENV